MSNEAVTPAGNPETDKPTAELKFPVIVEVTVTGPLMPRGTVKAVGVVAIEKSDGTAFTRY